MKIKLVALLVIAVLPLMAFDCITSFSDVTLSLNLSPFNASYPLQTGSNHNYGGSVTIDPSTLYDQSYTLTGASIYDITVQTKGPDDLGANSGSVTVNGIEIFSYNANWTDFTQAQSLLTSSKLKQNPLGVSELISAVTGHRPAVFALSGTSAGIPKANLSDYLVVTAYVQAYGHK